MMNRASRARRILFCLVVVAVLAVLSPQAWAWHDEGHVYAARAAVAALPDSMPAFFRKGIGQIAHSALDPDVDKNKALPQLNAAESPRHFIDLELLKGHPLPKTQWEFDRLCAQLHEKPERVGMLPYAIMENEQRLAMAFAEYRRWPDNPYIQNKALVIAGVLSHYTSDLGQPLHTTVDHDGRIDAQGRSPHTGFHLKVDSLPSEISYATLFATPPAPPEAHVDDLFAYIQAELGKSHALVDRVYQLEPVIPPMRDPNLQNKEVIDFTIERMQASAHFTASIFLTAWERSARIHVPDWLDRSFYDEHFDPDTVPARRDKSLSAHDGQHLEDGAATSKGNGGILNLEPQIPDQISPANLQSEIQNGSVLDNHICSASASDHLLMATLWFQRSAEARAMQYQGYQLAQLRLDQALRDYDAQTTARKPAAIITDIDETILNNSPFEARLILSGQGYSSRAWQEWTARAQAKAIPGAVEFLQYAASRGVAIFYVSNRSVGEMMVTLENLTRCGFPGVDQARVLLLHSGTADKTSRRQEIESKYQVLLLLGDNLCDFDGAFNTDSRSKRLEALRQMQNKIGERFIILPNPMYGNWESAIYGSPDGALTDAQRELIRRGALRSY